MDDDVFKRFMRVSSQPAEGITRGDIWKIYERVNVGDRIKYRNTSAYFTKDEETEQRSYRKGVVVDKQAYYCVVQNGLGVRDGVLWLDVILDNEDDE